MGKLFKDGTEEEERDFIEAHRLNQFLVRNQRPLSWLFVANRHKRAADILYEVAHAAAERDMQRFLSGVDDNKSGRMDAERLRDMHDQLLLSEYCLLVGYALENCFKGCLLARNPTLVQTGALDRFVRGHELGDLADKCAFPISPEERDLLGTLSRHVVWGKYPAPLLAKDMPSGVDPEESGQTLSIINAFVKRRLQVLVDGVFGRIASVLEALNPTP